MAVARTYGAPRSKVMGRGEQATTWYYYDDRGRLTHSVTKREPEWLDEDFEWALADLAEQANKCEGCGEPLSETTAPEAEDTYEVSSLRCHACTPLEHQRKEDAEANAKAGLLYRVEKSP